MGGRARPWEASEAAANNATRTSQTHFMYTSYTNTYHTHIVSDFLLYVMVTSLPLHSSAVRPCSGLVSASMASTILVG